MHLLLGLVFVASAIAVLPSEAAADFRADQHCLQVIAPVEADLVPASENFVRARCAGGAESAFRHDAQLNFSRTTRALTIGEIVPAYPEFGENIVRPGQALSVVVASGPILVERRVEAMQSARPGERLFVKSPDGAIFSARYERVSP